MSKSDSGKRRPGHQPSCVPRRPHYRWPRPSVPTEYVDEALLAAFSGELVESALHEWGATDATIGEALRRACAAPAPRNTAGHEPVMWVIRELLDDAELRAAATHLQGQPEAEAALRLPETSYGLIPLTFSLFQR